MNNACLTYAAAFVQVSVYIDESVIYYSSKMNRKETLIYSTFIIYSLSLCVCVCDK